MARFVLVHGAWHGAWCWAPLAAELQARGHSATAVDLPCADPAAGTQAYAEVVLASTGDDPEHGVVLVGHSLGGLTVPVVAERMLARGRPVQAIVLVSALIPRPGMSFDDQVRAGNRDGGRRIMVAGFGRGQTAHPDGSSSWPEREAVADLYSDLAAADARSAARRLRRQAWLISQEVTPLRAWPAVPTMYVLGLHDRAIQPDWSRWAALELLGVAAVELGGGHSLMLSQPAELADVLTAVRPGPGSRTGSHEPEPGVSHPARGQ